MPGPHPLYPPPPPPASRTYAEEELGVEGVALEPADGPVMPRQHVFDAVRRVLGLAVAREDLALHTREGEGRQADWLTCGCRTRRGPVQWSRSPPPSPPPLPWPRTCSVPIMKLVGPAAGSYSMMTPPRLVSEPFSRSGMLSTHSDSLRMSHHSTWRRVVRVWGGRRRSEFR